MRPEKRLSDFATKKAIFLFERLRFCLTTSKTSLDFKEYLPKLVETIAKGTIKAQGDLGEKSPEGMFVGLDQVYRTEELLLSAKNLGIVAVKIHDA